MTSLASSVLWRRSGARNDGLQGRSEALLLVAVEIDVRRVGAAVDEGGWRHSSVEDQDVEKHNRFFDEDGL